MEKLVNRANGPMDKLLGGGALSTVDDGEGRVQSSPEWRLASDVVAGARCGYIKSKRRAQRPSLWALAVGSTAGGGRQ
jgi:hypothetical protein